MIVVAEGCGVKLRRALRSRGKCGVQHLSIQKLPDEKYRVGRIVEARQVEYLRFIRKLPSTDPPLEQGPVN